MKKQIALMAGILGIISIGCDKEIDHTPVIDSKDSIQIETHLLLINSNGANYIEYLYTDSTVISYKDYKSGEYKEYSYTDDSIVV